MRTTEKKSDRREREKEIEKKRRVEKTKPQE